jgi:hypothetical protein
MPGGRLKSKGASVAVAVVILALAGCEPLGPDELKREVQSIHSVAAEGSVLADQVAAQDTKRTFARVQARELSDAAGHSAERLTDAHPAEGLAEDTTRAIDLAERTESAIGQVELAPDDAEGAHSAAAQLRRLADQTDALAQSL